LTLPDCRLLCNSEGGIEEKEFEMMMRRLLESYTQVAIQCSGKLTITHPVYRPQSFLAKTAEMREDDDYINLGALKLILMEQIKVTYHVI
jgi:hypothetical protein